MLKHIVMWKLKEFAEGKTKAENALIMKESLERLVGIVPEIISYRSESMKRNPIWHTMRS